MARWRFIQPCRVADPDRKGKVESGVGHAQKTPLKGMRFESPQEAQAYLDHWETHWADTRIHGTTKRQVAAMFAEEKPALRLVAVGVNYTNSPKLKLDCPVRDARAIERAFKGAYGPGNDLYRLEAPRLRGCGCTPEPCSRCACPRLTRSIA